MVLDLLMPGMDGFEFLKRFRRSRSGRGTPVIVWTDKDLTQEERVRLKRSAQAVVLKSQGTAALLEEVRTHVPLPHAADARPAGRPLIPPPTGPPGGAR